MNVLIVEDEAITALMLAHTLKQMGHAVVAQNASGEEAPALAAESGADLVLMDIVLTGEIDGVEAAHRIRATQDIPIVFMSAYTLDEIRERIRVVRNTTFLPKPLEPEMLHEAFALLSGEVL